MACWRQAVLASGPCWPQGRAGIRAVLASGPIFPGFFKMTNGTITNQGIYRYLLFQFKKSEVKIGEATDFLFFNWQRTNENRKNGFNFLFTYFRFNIVK